MALTEQTIEVYRGEQAALLFTMDPAEDITGHTLLFTVTKWPNRTQKILGPLTMTITSGIGGTFKVELAEEDLDLPPAVYRFDVWRTDEGFEQAKAIGDFIVRGNSLVPPVGSP